MRYLSIFVFLAVFFSTEAFSQQADLTSVKDNTLYETADGSTSNGAGAHFFVGRVSTSGGGKIRRGLIKFDIASAVPAGSTITSVQLRLNMSKTSSGSTSVTVVRATSDWGERSSNADANEGSGAPSLPGDATWIHRFKDTTMWTNPGGDFAVPVSATLAVNAAGAYTWNSTPQLVSDVQGWLNDPGTNFGWILAGDETGPGTSKRFDSRENPAPGDRPRLSVTYTIPTSVNDNPAAPSEFALIGNFPNPFNPSTQISFSLSSAQPARLTIYNLLGVKVATLIDRPMSAGRHVVTWNAVRMPSGMYFARLEAGGMSTMKRMILAK